MFDIILYFAIFSIIMAVINITAVGWLSFQMAKFLYEKMKSL